MQTTTQDRRQHPRGAGLLTKIEDITYATLRKSDEYENAVERERPADSSSR